MAISLRRTRMEAELKRLRRENEVLRQERDILKKAMRIVSHELPNHRAEPDGQPSQRQQDYAVLLTPIWAVYQAGRGLYGSPRNHAALRQQGARCSRKRVARLMNQASIYSRWHPKRRVRTTDSRHNRAVAPNLLGIWTDKGWLYLARLTLMQPFYPDRVSYSSSTKAGQVQTLSE